jgi:YD repeat-containing protein
LATIIAAEATLNLFDTAGTELSRDAVTAMLIQNWWTDQAFDNQVNISRGAGGARFVRQPDGYWQAEPGSNAELVQTGTRVEEAKVTPFDPPTGITPSYPPRTISSAFDRSALSFTYTGIDGTVESFTYGVDLTTTMYPPEQSTGFSDGWVIGSGSTFLPQTSTLASGVVLTYTWSPASAPVVNSQIYTGEVLSQVSVGAPFRRQINFVYENNPNGIATLHDEEAMPNASGHNGAAKRLASINDGDGRSVSYSYDGTGGLTLRQSSTLTSATNLEGEVTGYRYTDFAYPVSGTALVPFGVMGSRVRLSEVRMPHDPGSAFYTFGYDSEARTRSVTNARSQAWQYFSGESARGRSLDPLDWENVEYYDWWGRTFATLSEAGIVTTRQLDRLGRVTASDLGTSSTFPNARKTREESYYDAFGNTVLSRTLPRTYGNGTPFAGDPIDTVTEFGYPDFPTLPTLSIDPLGHQSLTCYAPGQTDPAGLSRCAQVQTPVNNPDGLPRGTFGPSGEVALYDYDQYGRLTRERVLVEE